MKKRMFGLVFALVCIAALLLALPVGATETETGETASISGTFGRSNVIKWELVDGTLYITGDGYMDGVNSPEKQPWYAYREEIHTVVFSGELINIYSHVCSGLTNLKQVTIPDTVIVIMGRAFLGCSSLESITIPDAVYDIGEYAFSGCTSLKYVEFPENLEMISDLAFDGCSSLETLTFGSKLRLICREAFWGCRSLKSVSFSGDMPDISSKPFSTLSEEMLIFYYPEGNTTWSPDKVTYDKVGATVELVAVPVEDEDQTPDDQCGENLKWEYADGILTISGTGDMYAYDRNNMPPWEKYADVVTKVIVEEGVTSLSHKSFIDFSELMEVQLPNSLKTIGGQAFAHCTKLEKIVIPENLESIGDFTFNECSGLKEVRFCGDAIQYMIEFDVFRGVDAILYYPAGNETWTEDIMYPEGAARLDWRPWCVKDHTEVIEAGKAATCTEDGLTEGKHCSACGEVLAKQEVIPATGHTEVTDEAKAATCTEDGLTEGKHCSACGEVLTAQETVPAIGHSYGDWAEVKAPTVEEEGVQERLCGGCGGTEQMPIAKLDPPEAQPDPSKPAETQPETTAPAGTDDTKEPGNGGWIIAVVVAVLAAGAAVVLIVLKRKK